MCKYKIGDYIKLSKVSVKEVMDKLLDGGENLSLMKHPALARTLFKNLDGVWELCNNPFYKDLRNDITESFLVSTQPLPEKWYIDCGDKMEVREWLEDMGYISLSGQSLTKSLLDHKVLYMMNYKTKKGVVAGCHEVTLIARGYTKIIPVTSTKPVTIQVKYISGFNIESPVNKELEALENSYKELGEKIKALKG